MWSRKSSIIFWFSSVPMKRFHLSVFTRSTQKACSRRKSTLSSDSTTPTLSEDSWDTCTPPFPPLFRLLRLVLAGSSMDTQEKELRIPLDLLLVWYEIQNKIAAIINPMKPSFLRSKAVDGSQSSQWCTLLPSKANIPSVHQLGKWYAPWWKGELTLCQHSIGCFHYPARRMFCGLCDCNPI